MLKLRASNCLWTSILLIMLRILRKEDMLGILKSKKRGSRKKQNCVLFRSATTATALSFEGITIGT